MQHLAVHALVSNNGVAALHIPTHSQHILVTILSSIIDMVDPMSTKIYQGARDRLFSTKRPRISRNVELFARQKNTRYEYHGLAGRSFSKKNFVA